MIDTIILALFALAIPIAAVLFCRGFSVNGKRMRFDPASHEPARSWYIEGDAARDGEPVPLSCSFVEFDERGDFLDLRNTGPAKKTGDAIPRRASADGGLLSRLEKQCPVL
jgi:hypothetical protein